jgi:hypothetical protein
MEQFLIAQTNDSGSYVEDLAFFPSSFDLFFERECEPWGLESLGIDEPVGKIFKANFHCYLIYF